MPRGTLLFDGIRLQLAGRIVYAQTQGLRWRSLRTGYRRFATAAEAIRFAVEKFPAIRTLGAWMQVGDESFDSDEICQLYKSSDYPLGRAVSGKDG